METEQDEIIRQAMSIVGSIKSEKKAASSRENGKLGGAPMKALADIPCTCKGGDTLDHRAYCRRGQAIRYRTKKGLPLT